jgi:hypothetical protein
MNAEIRKQQFVFEHTDVVTTPYEYLTEELKSWSQERCKHQPSFVTLPHFFDRDDFLFEKTDQHPSEVFRVVYAGDVYVGSEPQWKQFQTTIESVETSLSSQTHLRFDIYTHAKMPAFIADMKSVHIHAPIGKDVFHTMQNADALLIVLPENKKNERTTKFFEYLPLRKPILIIAPSGEATSFVEHNQLGVHAQLSHDALQSFFTGDFNRYHFNRIFPIETHTANSRADEVIELLS